MVASAVGQALGLRELSNRTLAEVICELLRSEGLLLVLDNLEHLLDARPFLVQLLTSARRGESPDHGRAVLDVCGDRSVEVAPLEVPQGIDPERPDAQTYSAVRLFVERAPSDKQSISLNAQNNHDVVKICRRLDGIPLSMELAASRGSRLCPPRSYTSSSGPLPSCRTLLVAGQSVCEAGTPRMD